MTYHVEQLVRKKNHSNNPLEQVLRLRTGFKFFTV